MHSFFLCIPIHSDLSQAIEYSSLCSRVEPFPPLVAISLPISRPPSVSARPSLVGPEQLKMSSINVREHLPLLLCISFQGEFSSISQSSLQQKVNNSLFFMYYKWSISKDSVSG